MDAEYLELISLNIWHIIATIANLLILTLILKKFLFKPVQNVLAQRKKEVETLYTGAEEAKAQAESDKKLYSEKLRGAKEEADSIIKTASARADKLGDEIVNEAKQKASDTVKKAEADIEREKKKALNELKPRFRHYSADRGKRRRKRNKEDDHRELIDSFIDKL